MVGVADPLLEVPEPVTEDEAELPLVELPDKVVPNGVEELEPAEAPELEVRCKYHCTKQSKL